MDFKPEDGIVYGLLLIILIFLILYFVVILQGMEEKATGLEFWKTTLAYILGILSAYIGNKIKK